MIVACSDSSDVLTPEPESTPTEQNYRLEDGVIEIKGNNLDYIVDAIEGTTLVLSENYPLDELPTIGEIVFVYPNSKKLNHGFLGRVIQIEKSDGNYSFVTEAVAIDEAFSYLNIDEEVELELITSDKTGKMVLDSPFSSRSDYDIPFKHEYLPETTIQLLNYWQFKTEGEFKYGGKISHGVKYDKKNDVCYQYVKLGSYLYFNSDSQFVLTNSNLSEDEKTGMSFDKTQVFKHELPFAIRIPAGAVSFFATPTIQPEFVIKLEGQLVLGFDFDFLIDSAIEVEYKNKKWSIKKGENENILETTFKFDPKGEITLSGEAFLGFALTPEINLFGRKDLSIEITPAFGAKAASELSYDPINDTSIYEALMDENVSIGGSLVVGASTKAHIWKFDVGWSKDIIDLSKEEWEKNFYIFPSFKEDQLRHSQDKLVASTELGRDLLWKQDVGLALYKGDECIERSDSVEYKFEENFKEENPLEATFGDIVEDEKDDYSIWSYVKWGDRYIKCEQLIPQKRIKKLQIKEMMDGYSNVIDTYYFNYRNDSIDNIVYKENDDITITYKFSYLDDGIIKVYANETDEHTTYTLKLNDEGYIKSCDLSYYSDEGNDNINYEFEYDKTGRMTCMKCSEGDETWKLVYDKKFNATSVTLGGKKVNGISYGNQESSDHWVLHEWMYGLDVDDEMEFFGLLGMLGKSSKYLPSVNKYLYENSTIYYNWSLDSYGYPDNLVLDEDGTYYVMNFSWE